MGKFFQGYYTPVNKAKYIGDKLPVFRSSWEHTVMIMFDNNPNIISWASEPLKIPYRNPFTGKQTVYVPDFLVLARDDGGELDARFEDVKGVETARFRLVRKLWPKYGPCDLHILTRKGSGWSAEIISGHQGVSGQ